MIKKTALLTAMSSTAASTQVSHAGVLALRRRPLWAGNVEIMLH